MAGLADAAGGGGMGGPMMGPPGGGGNEQVAMIMQMATQILGRPPRDLQEAAQAVFSQAPTDAMGSQLEGAGAQPPFLPQGGPPGGMPQPGGMPGGMPMPMAPQMPQPQGGGPQGMPYTGSRWLNRQQRM
jgi:hypothetical protein